MSERDLQRWSHEVAEDPGAPSFVPLARAYRRQGRRSAARDVVLAGLERNPEHVEAHGLLALIHIEDGERQQAGDEWETVLRLDPGNFGASRGLGFLALERGDLSAARRHLDTAARARPDDPPVMQALKVLERREGSARSAAEGAAEDTAERAAERVPEGAVAAPGTAGADPRGRDPSRLFAPLAGESPFLGALVLDPQGLVLAGRLGGGDEQGELLGALLNTAVSEAARTTRVLGLGAWQGILMECAEAIVHVTALGGGSAVVVVAEREAPAGWVVRTARRAAGLASDFMEEAQ